MSHAFWYWVTGWGDEAVMFPVALLLTAWLAQQGAWPPLRRWVLAFVLASLLVVGSKLGYVLFGLGIPALQFRGISGHSFNAAAILPVLLVLLVQPAHSKRAVSVWAVGVALGMLIGFSRLRLGVHSTSEVISGLLLGSLTSAICLSGQVMRHFQPRQRGGFCVAVLALGGILHGLRAPTDELLFNIAHAPATVVLLQPTLPSTGKRSSASFTSPHPS